jgi:hypothetical protein
VNECLKILLAEKIKIEKKKLVTAKGSNKVKKNIEKKDILPMPSKDDRYICIFINIYIYFELYV